MHFRSPSQKTTGQKYRKVHSEGEKNSPDWRVGLYFYSPILDSTHRLASGFVFLLANLEFYSHLASWRLVIRTLASTMLIGMSKI
jgi:hypothetical protein